MINMKFVAIVFALGLFLSISCVVSRLPMPGEVLAESEQQPHQGENIVMSPYNIDPAGDGAFAENSKSVSFTLSITQLGSPICLLDGANFKLETLFVPPDGPGVHIASVYDTSSDCQYFINLLPDQICKSTNGPATPAQCKQLTWKPGAYSVKLVYIKEGKELANTIINFYIVSQPGSGGILGKKYYKIPGTDKSAEANKSPKTNCPENFFDREYPRKVTRYYFDHLNISWSGPPMASFARIGYKKACPIPAHSSICSQFISLYKIS